MSVNWIKICQVGCDVSKNLWSNQWERRKSTKMRTHSFTKLPQVFFIVMGWVFFRFFTRMWFCCSHNHDVICDYHGEKASTCFDQFDSNSNKTAFHFAALPDKLTQTPGFDRTKFHVLGEFVPFANMQWSFDAPRNCCDNYTYSLENVRLFGKMNLDVDVHTCSPSTASTPSSPSSPCSIGRKQQSHLTSSWRVCSHCTQKCCFLLTVFLSTARTKHNLKF